MNNAAVLTSDVSERDDDSSLPILLSISAAVLLSVVVGWYALDDSFPLQLETSGPIADFKPDLSRDIAPDSELTGREATDEQLEAESAAKSVEDPVIGPAIPRVDSNLRKARLAADAEILAYPEDQSALFYYNQILAVDPDHAVAKAEIENVLRNIAQIAATHLVAEEYAEAHQLAVVVARRNEGHALVDEVARELDRLANVYVEQAIQFAQDGNDEEMTTALSAAEEFPGRNTEYFSALRESIANIQNSRIATERSQLEKVRLAAIQATAARVARFHRAIAAGRLILPQGESAFDYLSERQLPQNRKEELTNELIGALIAECTAKMNLGNLDDADQLLRAATKLRADNVEIQSLRNTLEAAYVEAESGKILTMDDFVRRNVVSARYPRRAEERNISGWVEVQFTVTTSGETENIEIQDTEPSAIFDTVAVQAVEQWTFEPRVFRGQAISQRVSARLAFRIQ